MRPLIRPGRRPRRKGLIIGLTVAGAIAVVAVVLLATVLSRIFGDVGNGLGGDELGLNSPSSSSSADQPAASGSVIKPARATVFSPEGEADAPELAPLAIDGNQSTVWPIDTYSDPVPFPNFKNGVGLMLQLSEPATLGSVTINLNSTGTSVQIRSSDTRDTVVVGQHDRADRSDPAEARIQHDRSADAQPTSYVLVWVSTLGKVGGESRSDIAEITLNAAS